MCHILKVLSIAFPKAYLSGLFFCDTRCIEEYIYIYIILIYSLTIFADKCFQQAEGNLIKQSTLGFLVLTIFYNNQLCINQENRYYTFRSAVRIKYWYKKLFGN